VAYDADDSGIVDAADVAAWAPQVGQPVSPGGSGPAAWADFDASGAVDDADMALINAAVGQSVPGMDFSLLSQSARPTSSGWSMSQPLLAGDCNGDGRLDAGDIDVMTSALGDCDWLVRRDLDGDGVLGSGDRDRLIRDVLGTRHGDSNLDGAVETADLVAMSMHWNRPGGWADGDANGDGRVELCDLVAMTAAWGWFRPAATVAKVTSAGPGMSGAEAQRAEPPVIAMQPVRAAAGRARWAYGPIADPVRPPVGPSRPWATAQGLPLGLLASLPPATARGALHGSKVQLRQEMGRAWHNVDFYTTIL
jgi:hypothetical protein